MLKLSEVNLLNHIRSGGRASDKKLVPGSNSGSFSVGLLAELPNGDVLVELEYGAETVTLARIPQANVASVNYAPEAAEILLKELTGEDHGAKAGRRKPRRQSA